MTLPSVAVDLETVSADTLDLRLLDHNGERTLQAALGDLFSGDGTIYLVVGFFTYNGYLEIREHIRDFLSRSADNELVIVIGPASDQFSPRIAQDLWDHEVAHQVSINKRPRGLHAKLYLRDGPTSHMILTSANLTRVGFEYNVELGMELKEGEASTMIEAYRSWAEDLADGSAPLSRRDLIFPLPLLACIINWTNKAKLLPRQYLVRRITPYLVVLLAVAIMFRVV